MKHLLIGLSFLLLVSCGQEANRDKENDEAETRAKEEAVVKIRKDHIQALNSISQQFGASYMFDTVRSRMTYQYQKLLSQNDRVIIDSCIISDIEKVDTLYNVSVIKVKPRKMYIYFTCAQSQLAELINDTSYHSSINTHIYDKYLILKINSIKKMKLNISSYNEDNSVVELKTANTFTFKGELIGTYLKTQK